MVQSLGNSGGCCMGYTQYIALILSHISLLSPAKNMQIKTAGQSLKKADRAKPDMLRAVTPHLKKICPNAGKMCHRGKSAVDFMQMIS